MKSLTSLAVAATLLAPVAVEAGEAMQQHTKDRVSAYVRVSIAWIANESCMFVMGDEREGFLDNVALNVVGLNRELSDTGTDPRTASAFLRMLQGQAIKQFDENYRACGKDVEGMVHDGIMEAVAINESIAKHGPYVDPRRK